MAKRRRMGRKGSFFGGSRRKRSSSRSGSSGENLVLVGVAAAGYGVARPYLEKWIQPITSKIPVLGAYVDEAALGTLGYLAARGKFGSNKYVKSIGKAMFIVECTRVGSGIGSGMINQSSGNTTAYDY
jgi:hypothetical protein